MRVLHGGRGFWMAALLFAATVGGCRRAIIIVPQPEGAYTERDTLYGYHRGNRVVVSFRFDSVLRVDTVTKLDTVWRAGTRTIVRVDTVRVPTPVTTPTTVTPVIVPTRVPSRPGTTPRNPTSEPPTTGTPGRVDTVIVIRRDTLRLGRVDTVRVVVTDTLRITVRDTLRITVRDTLRVAGRRTLFVPPGQYPPEGQCRIWIHNLAPGRQAAAAPCASLGNIPAGAFILFGGDAWDADYDWVAESQRGSVPAEIIAVSRRRRP